MIDDVNLEAYKQAFETMRYYGNLRFTVLTAFIIITGGLFTVALSDSTRVKDFFRNFCFGGILIGVVFGLAEFRIAQNFDYYIQMTVSLGSVLKMNEAAIGRPGHQVLWRWLIEGLMLSVYASSVGMWALFYRKQKRRSRQHTTQPGTA